MLARGLLSSSNTFTSVRCVSSKYPRPTPRPYKRRLFEAALQPVLPKQLKACIPPGVVYENKMKENNEYSDVEIALADLVKKWIRKEEFRVMAICQFQPVQGRTLWLSKNQLRMKGVEFRNYGNRIVKKIFSATPLSSLNVSLVGSNAQLFGKDLDSIKTIVAETEKLNWIVPLVFVMDGRIVSCEQAKQLASLRSMEDMRTETVQILQSQLGGFSNTLDRATRDLSGSLSNLEQMKGGNSDPENTQ